MNGADTIAAQGAEERCSDTTVDVSAVVVNHNGGDRIVRAIGALIGQPYPLSQVLVVDNASKDGSTDHIRAAHPAVRILDLGDNLGLSAARNAGLRAVLSPLVLLIDHDIYVENGAITAMVEAWRAERPAVVCPRIRLLPEREVVQAEGAAPYFLGTMALRHAYQPIAKLGQERAFVGGCIGACYLVDRAIVLDAGGFDELFFFYFEDLEFSLRLRTMGHRFLCAPRAEVYHERSAGTPGLSFRGAGLYPTRRAYLTMRNRLLTMLIHYRLRTLVVLAPALLLYEAATFAMAARRGWLGAWGKAWISQLRLAGTIAERRRWMRQRRRADDGDLLKGGELPLAQGFLGSAAERWLANRLSRFFNAYWRVARRWVD